MSKPPTDWDIDETWPEPDMPEWKDEPPPSRYDRMGAEAFAAMLEDSAAYAAYNAYKNGKADLNGPKPNGPDRTEEPQPFETVRASIWHEQPVPEVDFLDDRKLIPIRYATIFTGAAGVGKTYVALQAAIASAAGLPWLGASIKKGPSIFYSAEENLDVLHMRVAKICFAMNIHLDRLQDLHFVDLSEIVNAALISCDSRTGMAIVTELYRRLDASMSAIKPVSSWLDNKGLVITGNESDRTFIATGIRAFQLLAGKHDSAVVMLAHPSNTGLSSGTGASGSTAAFAGVRSVINMTKPDEEDTDDDVRILDNNKTNYSKAGTKVNIKWQLDHYVCTDIPRRAGDEIGKHDKAEGVFLKLLRWHNENNLEVSPNKNAGNYAPVLFEACKDNEGFHRKWFKMAMDNLLHRKLIEVAERGPPSKRVKFLRETIHEIQPL